MTDDVQKEKSDRPQETQRMEDIIMIIHKAIIQLSCIFYCVCCSSLLFNVGNTWWGGSVGGESGRSLQFK